MQRDPSAYRNDILEAAAAIRDATAAIDEASQAATRRLHSAVERDFIVVWGAIQTDLPELAEHCPQLITMLRGNARACGGWAPEPG
jgi:uncharacterized protein with HEPN domain